MKRLLLGVAALALAAGPALAAPGVTITGPNGKQATVNSDGSQNFTCVTGCSGGSGSNAGGGVGANPFALQGANVSLSASTTSANAAITAATTMLVTNPPGGSTAYCAPETTSGGTVTTSTGTPVPAGTSGLISQQQDAFVACITASGTASLMISPGITVLDGAIPPGTNTIGAVTALFSTNNAGVQPHICGSQATVSPSSATDTQIVALSSGKTVYVCDYSFSSNGTNDFYLESATSASCGGTLAQLGTHWYAQQFSGKSADNAYYRGSNTGASNGLCVHTNQAQSLSLTVYYDQY